MTTDEKILFLEKDLDELNMVVYKQSQRIDALEKQLAKLTQKFEDLGEISNEPPPHY